MGSARQIFIISDLHIGGAYPTTEHPRGFRMMTHVDVLARFVQSLADQPRGTELVVNGDFVDFLAEKGADGFQPFLADPAVAAARLDAIVDQDRPLFDAITGFLRRGHRLTVLLGNHDVELSLPLVRERLREHVGARDDGAFSFIYDGEAYVVGDALIEHGNRYDGFNVVDYDALRRLRSWQSRGFPPDDRVLFRPPAGSRLVAEVMNGIKRDYPFIDLLKPETEAAIPILLTIDPGLRRHVSRIVQLQREAKKHDPIAPGEPRQAGDISAVSGAAAIDEADQALDDALRAVLPPAQRERILDTVRQADTQGESGDVSDGSLSTKLTLVRLAFQRRSSEIEARLPALLAALRVVQSDQSFNTEVETDPRIVEAAVRIAQGGFKWVVFGHTHLAKKVRLDQTEQAKTLGLRREATYLNSGTWADLIRFPREIFALDPAKAVDRVRDLVTDMATDGYRKWITFEPSYVRLDFDGKRVRTAELLRDMP